MPTARTQNLVVISDTHCGDTLGLYPGTSRIVKLDEGGYYHASPQQKKVWEMWKEFWRWVPKVLKGERYDLVHNGDAVEGTHHGSVHQITSNIGNQIKIAEAVMGPIIENCLKSGGTYFQVRGTEAHVGASGWYEEELAKKLGAKPNAIGQYARYELWKHVGGSLVHLLHHIGTTGSAAHEASAVNAEFTAEMTESARWRETPPDFVVRSHRHRFIAVDLDTANGLGASIVTPGWQLKTPFAWKIPGARVAPPQFGGIIIRHGDEEAHFRRRIWSVGRTRVE